VRETEEELAVMGCLAETGFCRIEGCCVLRHALREATLAFLRTLDGYTLADLLAPGARLVRSLGLDIRDAASGMSRARISR
jgi:Rrf2 family transcriptional regulator, nitric oxide-sensitive transcriptional repressor